MGDTLQTIVNGAAGGSRLKVYEIEIKTVQLENEPHQLVVMSDISYILRNERSQIKSNFQEQLTATLSHEQLTPLNSIINLSDIQTRRY
jgi:signal transduction histidine kinase